MTTLINEGIYLLRVNEVFEGFIVLENLLVL